MDASKKVRIGLPDRKAVATAFGEVLRSARTRMERVSQEELAEMAEMDRTYASLLERGLRTPTLFIVIRVALALGSEPAKIVEEVVARLEMPKGTKS
jgi:transcriptional regulator with XRE-family HTH domain